MWYQLSMMIIIDSFAVPLINDDDRFEMLQVPVIYDDDRFEEWYH